MFLSRDKTFETKISVKSKAQNGLQRRFCQTRLLPVQRRLNWNVGDEAFAAAVAVAKKIAE